MRDLEMSALVGAILRKLDQTEITISHHELAAMRQREVTVIFEPADKGVTFRLDRQTITLDQAFRLQQNPPGFNIEKQATGDYAVFEGEGYRTSTLDFPSAREKAWRLYDDRSPT